MRLAAFIHANPQPIIKEWEAFAQTLAPAADHLTPLALRDHISQILTFIEQDIKSPQTEEEQIEKSQGEAPTHQKVSVAEIHASLRHSAGFNMDQMVSEYRALRASIIRLWQDQLTEITKTDIEDLIRFNESIDQTLTESIFEYSRKSDYSRNLFLGILSHDLRSPLATAQMSAKLTLKIDQTTLNERQKMLLAQIVECSENAIEIVNYLLDLTRARLGSGLPIIKAHMDMGFVSRQLVDEMRTRHPDRTFTLQVSGDTEGQWDKPRIGQVFTNLLSNAVQYGFTDLPINVAVTGQAEEVVLSVHNYGLPIAPDALGRIFESLIRGEDGESYNPPGSINLGLGLYITKEIVTAHNGTIRVMSSEKEGTTFIAKFPR